MKKFTFFMTMFIAFAMTAFAQIDTSKEYRLKYTAGTQELYMNIGTSSANTHGHVNVVAFAEDDSQIFTFISNGDETYKLKSKSGSYLQGHAWNVNATTSEADAMSLTFEAVSIENLEYKIKWYNPSKGANKYFKVEAVAADGYVYHPFGDADAGAVFQLVEVTTVEPELPTEEEIATRVAAANEALAFEGVGYPTAAPRATLQAAIEALNAEGSTENYVALQAAINAYYATEDVVLPEAGKAYTITMVTNAGNKFYLNYTGEDVAMTARTNDELPESAKFVCEAGDNGAVAMKTNDGKYLVYHSKYAGVNWLQNGGNTKGFQDEKSEMTNITFAKLAAGGNVSATNAEVFGLLSWYGMRGYDTGKNENTYGYMVLKTDGSDYDGASAPFFNNNFSSAFILEEVEVAVVEPEPELPALEITGYTPTEAVESLETITITFNDEIEGTFDMMAMDQIYLGSRSNGCSYVVDGNVLTITPFNAITTPGEYALVIPEGLISRKVNGEKISLNGEIAFTVKEATVVEPEPEVPTVDGIIVGLNNIPEAVTAPADIKTGYYLLKQVNDDAAGSGTLGYIKADAEMVNAAVSTTATAPTAGANNEATYVWYVEKADDGSITIATANKAAYWQAPWQGQKNLAAEPSALGVVTESVSLGGKTATPTQGSAMISNNNPDNLSLVHYSGRKLGSWNDANPASVWFVEFIEVDIEDLNVLSEVEITYNYTYNGQTVKTENFTVAKGTALPAITLPYGVVTQTVLPETATETATYEIVCELDLAQLPFAPAASYGEIEKWYYMTIHATAPDYLYYAEGQEYIPLNVESLPEENLDAYTWAFVGNPFTGYQIVNKLAGESMILSSANPNGNDGNTFPILVDATAVPEGNNTHWDASISSHAENGFFLAQHGTTYNMNNRSDKLAYWTGGADAGSTFLLTEREITVEPEEPTVPTLNETVVFDFANNSWGIPTMEENNYSSIKTAGEYTDGVNTIKIDPTANKGSYIYDNKGFLNISKTGSKITLPAFNFAVEKIEVVGHSSATSYPNVDMNVYVGETAVSTACIGSTATSTFEIAADNQAAGNVYELVIGSNGGNYSSIMYITYIKVYPAENKLEAPAFDLASGVYVGEQTVNVHSATADIEGVTDVTYYYTTDGNEPTVEDEETDGEIIITESCTLKVIVELTYGDKVYVSASTSAEYIISEAVTYHRAVAVENGSYFLAANGHVAAPLANNVLPAVETTIDGNDLTEAAYYAITLEEAAEAGTYYIKDVNGNYIYTSSTYGTSGPKLSSNGAYVPMSSWTITIADDENSTATIVSEGLTLVYDTAAGVFKVTDSVSSDMILPTFYGVYATGIENVITNGEAIESIYDLTGRKIETITKGGIYIVNGKKVLVK